MKTVSPFETAASLPPRGEGDRCLGDHAHDVAFLHDQEVLAVQLDLGARPFAEQHAVADLEVDRDQLAGLVAAAGADGGDFALRGLFLGAVGNDDAALGFFLGVDTLDHNTVMQRTKFGFSHDGSFGGLRSGVWFAIESVGIRDVTTPRKAPDRSHPLSNRSVGVLIVRREYGVALVLSSKRG